MEKPFIKVVACLEVIYGTEPILNQRPCGDASQNVVAAFRRVLGRGVQMVVRI